jgi:UDP-N-acetyl-D-mannosaminuronic acid transferase (WecB/TagA/CpsF family)
MTSDNALNRLTETLHIYREAHDQRFNKTDQTIGLLGEKIELLAGTLSDVNSTIREFNGITQQQGRTLDKQTEAIQQLITLAQQQQIIVSRQQEAIDRLLARN